MRKEGEAPPVEDFVKVETPASKQREAAALRAQANHNPNGVNSQPGSARTSTEAPRVLTRPAPPTSTPAPATTAPPVSRPPPAPAPMAAPATQAAPQLPRPAPPAAAVPETADASDKEKEDVLQAAYKACEHSSCSHIKQADIPSDESKRKSQTPTQ